MSKEKKLVKKALKHPKMYSKADLQYFKMWLSNRKKNKKTKNTDVVPTS